MPDFLFKFRGGWKATYFCLMFSKQFFCSSDKAVTFFHSCQIVIHLSFAGKTLINSLIFQNFHRIPWMKNLWRINIDTSAVLSQIRFVHTYPEAG